MIDLSPILDETVKAVAIVSGAVITATAARLFQRFNIQIDQAKLTNLDAAVEKCVQAGGVMAEGEARQKGWDHIDVKNSIVSYGLGALVNRFPDTIRSAGLDPTTPEGSQRLRDIVTRALPVAIAPVANSPATTNGPPLHAADAVVAVINAPSPEPPKIITEASSG